MFQKELGEKIVGKFPSSEYGRISILSNYRLDIINKFLISPNCFFPRPKVTSMIIQFKPKKQMINLNINNLEKITQIFFSNKRKMINKNFLKLFENHDVVAKKLNIDLSLRPNQLNENNFYKIVEYYEKNKKT